MKTREVIIAALRRDPDLVPRMKASLRERIDEEEGAMSRVVQAAGALEPILADAVKKRPSRLSVIGLKSAHLLADLAIEDRKSSRRLENLARGGTIGIVFVDVAGFTTFTADNGDKAAIELLSTLGDIIEKSAKAGKGEIVKRLGDGFLLAFSSASQAVRAAVSLQESARRQKASGGFDIELRVAVHAGEPLIDQDDLLGHDVNLTARLLDCCKPGRVVISEAAKEMAEKRLRKIAFGNPRRAKIRGLAGKVTIYEVDPENRVSTA
jgi:eukaryotic-like serine/threonine-protein kinase